MKLQEILSLLWSWQQVEMLSRQNRTQRGVWNLLGEGVTQAELPLKIALDLPPLIADSAALLICVPALTHTHQHPLCQPASTWTHCAGTQLYLCVFLKSVGWEDPVPQSLVDWFYYVNHFVNNFVWKLIYFLMMMMSKEPQRRKFLTKRSTTAVEEVKIEAPLCVRIGGDSWAERVG